MNKILIIGGSKGIGNAIMKSLIDENLIVNLSRTSPLITHQNLTHIDCNVLTDELPEIEKIDSPTGMNYALNLELLTCTRKQVHQKNVHFRSLCCAKGEQHREDLNTKKINQNKN